MVLAPIEGPRSMRIPKRDGYAPALDCSAIYLPRNDGYQPVRVDSHGFPSPANLDSMPRIVVRHVRFALNCGERCCSRWPNCS